MSKKKRRNKSKKLQLHVKNYEELEAVVARIVETGRLDVELLINPLLFAEGDRAICILEKLLARHPKVKPSEQPGA